MKLIDFSSSSQKIAVILKSTTGQRTACLLYTSPVAQGVNHGAAPIPEEAKWVKAKEIKDISGLTHGVGSVSYTHLIQSFRIHRSVGPWSITVSGNP